MIHNTARCRWRKAFWGTGFDAEFDTAQKPLNHSTATYQAKGATVTGNQPARHQKLRPSKFIASSWPRMALWLIKKTVATSMPPPISQTPQSRRLALSSTVSPIHSRSIVLKSETAISAQSSQKIPVMANTAPNRRGR